MDSGTPLYSDPEDYTYGLHLYPDWSTRHNTRAMSIRPNSLVGWATGILVSGWVDQGIYIDTTMKWRDAPTNTVANDPRGIVFGSKIMTKMAFQTGETAVTPGVDTWKVNVEGDYLLFRGDAANWYIGMKNGDKNLYLVNALFRFGTNGRLNVNGVADVGAVNGAGITIQGNLAHPLAMTRSTVAMVAPGANVAVIRVEGGSTPGTTKLVAYSGTSTTGAVIVDNFGAGNS